MITSQSCRLEKWAINVLPFSVLLVSPDIFHCLWFKQNGPSTLTVSFKYKTTGSLITLVFKFNRTTQSLMPSAFPCCHHFVSLSDFVYTIYIIYTKFFNAKSYMWNRSVDCFSFLFYSKGHTYIHIGSTESSCDL